MKKCQFSWIGSFLHNKRDLRADGLPLQPSALRPRLLSRTGKPINYTAFLGFFIPNRGRKLSNVAKIVVMTTILSVFGLFSINFTTPVSAASLTLSVPTDTLKLGLQPNNTFAKSSSGSVSVKTDALGGYILSIKAKSSNELVNGSNKIASITGNLTEDQYKASGNTNTWGYQPSKINGSANTSFLPGPTTSLSTIEKTSAKNDTGNSYNFVIGAKVNSTLPNGSYSNTFVFTATANTVSYSITYNLNSGTWTETSPQTGNTVENTVAISDVAPTRTYYEFLGWCTVSTTTDTCSGTTVQPGKAVTLSSGANNIQLFARWKDLYNPQPTECKSLTSIGQTGTFTDPRDGVVYKIARLKDNKCWMTENLRITGGSSFKPGHSATLTQEDTDLNEGKSFTLPASNLSAFNTDGKSGGWTNYLEDNIAYYGNNTSYGAYYSWYTATAGSGKKSMTTQGQNATDSICPKGWKLPTGGTDSNSDYQQLYKQYTTGTQLAASPANFTYAGSVYLDGSFDAQGSYGRYWSSTVFGNTNAYYLRFNSGSVYPDNYGARPVGYSVRCVAR